MNKPFKKRASSPGYVSESQLVLAGFESPFSQKLDPKNRWVVLAKKIPWDELSNYYLQQVKPKSTGRPGISPRVVIGSLIIKHICNLDDRETVDQITENMYMQYFLGYSSFTTVPPFDPSLFVEFRNRLGMEQVNAINERIVQLSQSLQQKKQESDDPGSDDERDLHGKKPRTYRQKAHKEYLRVAQKKIKHKKPLRKAVGKQLRYLRRNLKSINKLLDTYPVFPLEASEQKYLMVLNTLYEQQNQMYTSGQHRIEDRIVSIHQPHIRPIVRGKAQAQVEFGAKVHVSLVDGYSFLDTLSWDAFNEGSRLLEYVGGYKARFGYYPEEVLADKIYCSRENRNQLKLLGIKLLAKPLGRKPAVREEHVRPGERNAIEGKFRQGKNAYGMGRIKARLKNTSESWIASIILVLNLVKLAGEVPLCFLESFSARLLGLLNRIIQNLKAEDF